MSTEKITPLEISLRPKNQEYISIYPIVCLHVGHVNSDIDKIKKLVGAIKNDPNAYIISDGDLTENSIPHSVAKQRGAMYDQVMNPKDQVDYVVELLTPVKHKILGILEGNHSLRSYYETSISVEALIAEKLNRPFLGIDGLFNIKVGKQDYKVFSTHGTGSASGPGGVIAATIKQSTRFEGFDVYIRGHSHTQVVTKLDIFTDEGVQKTRTFVATGSFLQYLNSYAHHALMVPATLGIPEIRLYSNIKDVRVIV